MIAKNNAQILKKKQLGKNKSMMSLMLSRAGSKSDLFSTHSLNDSALDEEENANINLDEIEEESSD
jgi:hypothetical protein